MRYTVRGAVAAMPARRLQPTERGPGLVGGISWKRPGSGTSCLAKSGRLELARAQSSVAWSFRHPALPYQGQAIPLVELPICTWTERNRHPVSLIRTRATLDHGLCRPRTRRSTDTRDRQTGPTGKEAFPRRIFTGAGIECRFAAAESFEATALCF